MSDRPILITGGAGYIGSHTVLAFREAGHEVVVLDDLSAVLTNEPEVRSVAVLYGAGHMAALEGALVEELGLELEEERWFTAVDLRFEDTGLEPSLIRMFRSTLASQLDSQLGAAGGR